MIGKGLLRELSPVNRKGGNGVNEKYKLRRFVEGLKDEIRTMIRVGMVDGRYTAFYRVKSAAEAL
jgi:hypothetical protein